MKVKSLNEIALVLILSLIVTFGFGAMVQHFSATTAVAGDCGHPNYGDFDRDILDELESIRDILEDIRDQK